ncbi:signal peptidase II [Sphingomonas sp.]|uniref:signal peptidase II n=1 Tax=Sphingomonas sp. TaxID=28214 RepID=UPI0035C86D44
MRVPALGLSVAVVLFVADQLVKWLVTGPLGIAALGDVHTILPIFDLRFVPNVGVSLGLFAATSDTTRWLLVAFTGAIAAGVLVWLWREQARWDQIALGLVLGGALGNILDRVRLGYVVDYADLHLGEWRPFLVFNVADAAITIGVLILLARALFTRDKPAAPAKADAAAVSEEVNA